MFSKIHKNPQNLPGTPIVSSSGAPLEKSHNMWIMFLAPGTPLQFIHKDTTYMINIVNEFKELPSHKLLHTLDVSSSYTNILHKEGISATKEMLAIHRSPHELLTTVTFWNY